MRPGLRIVPAGDQMEGGSLEPPPDPSQSQQTADAVVYLDRIRRGDGLALPWPDIAALTDDLLPGWFVVVGGRAKAGKTTMLLSLLNAWAEQGVPLLYVGTEQPAFVNRILWAAMRCGIPADEALAKHCAWVADHCVRTELDYLAAPKYARARVADSPRGTVEEFGYWAHYAADKGCRVMVYDHLHRLDTGDGDNAWMAFASAVRQIKDWASELGMLIVAGAQLKYGQNDPLLGAHEAPGDSSWYGGIRIQQEADVALQLWRPFVRGTTLEQKREAKDNGAIKNIVQQNIMAVRCAAHRYKNSAMGEVRRLFVRDGKIESLAPGA